MKAEQPMTLGEGRPHPANINNLSQPQFFSRLAIISTATVLLLSILMIPTDLDRKLAGFAYCSEAGWVGQTLIWCQWLYDFGCLPALGIALSALFIWIGGLFLKTLRKWSNPAAFLVLVMLLGPGLTINVVFKDNFGRPRPRDTAEFGGTHAFQPLGVPGIAGEGRSFPSGHASMGFYFGTLFFLCKRWNRPRWGWFALIGGLLYGTLMGWVRILQGGHFATDVLWSAVMVLAVAWLVNLAQGHFPTEGTASRVSARSQQVSAG